MVTQKDVEKLADEIKNSIVNDDDFLNKNYNILKKKRVNTRQERIFMGNKESGTLFYQSPESINLFVNTVCFYMALEKLGVPCNTW